MAASSDDSPTQSMDFVIGGHPIPDEFIGQLEDSSAIDDTRELRGRLADSGYFLLRGALDKDEVLTAREEVFSWLVEVGEIKPPALEGIVTGRSRRREIEDDLIAFWRSGSEGPALRQDSAEAHDWVPCLCYYAFQS